MNKTVLMMTCALGALAVSSGGACAATAAAAADASATASNNSSSTVSEIIVTAEKREQSIQTVPVAITAFGAQDRNLKGISTVQDMTDFTPGFTYSSQLDRPVMRGVARNNNIYTSDSAVAVYLDDFYSNSTFFIGRDDMLIDRVEIDLGPQGTLYGRNAIGGLINTIAKRPTDEWSGEFREIIGNYGYIKTEGTVSGPITDHLSFRFSFYDLNQTRGYYTNLDPGVPSSGDIRHDPYADIQFEYKTDKDDLWLDAYGTTFNNDRGGPGNLVIPIGGPYDASLVPNGSLTFGPNFAYGPTSGALCNPALTAFGCFSTPTATNPNPLPQPLGPVAGSVTGMVVPQNPFLTNTHQLASAVPEDINVRGAYDVVVHFTHHFDGVDLRYVGGYAQYRYNLFTAGILVPNDESPITSYQIPLLPVAIPGVGASCLALEAFGACGPLTVDATSRFQYETETKWTSHELTLISTTNKPVQWIAGIYFYHESDNNPETWRSPQPQIGAPISLAALVGGLGFVPTTPNPSQNFLVLDYQDNIQSAAGYAQVDWKVTPTLKLTAGIRYTYDWKSAFEEARYINFTGLGGVLPPDVFGSLLPAVDVTGAAISLVPAKGVTCPVSFPTTGLYAGDATRCLGDHSDAVTGTAGVEWTPDPDTLVYARYNRGYKAFGLNAGFVGANPEAMPEFINDFEAGVKKTFGRTLSVDIDGFYYDYSNDQIPISIFVGNPAVAVTEFINIPKAVSDGVELTANWVPIDHLDLSLTYGFNHTSISSSCAVLTGVGFCPINTQDFTINPATGLPVAGVLESVKGKELPQAPENKVAINATYTIPFEPGNLILSGTFIWKDKSYSDIFNSFYSVAPAWTQVNLRLTWSGHNDRYEIVGYVNNVFNSLGYDAASGGGLEFFAQGTGTPFEAPSYDYTPPRNYGVEFHYKF